MFGVPDEIEELCHMLISSIMAAQPLFLKFFS